MRELNHAYAYEITNQQLEHDSHQRTLERLYGIITFGSKSLGTINGAGAAAMLVFIQATLGQPAYPDFKPYGILALSWFLAGAFIAAISFTVQYIQINHLHNEKGKALFSNLMIWFVLFISASCALIGGITVTRGIAMSL